MKRVAAENLVTNRANANSPVYQIRVILSLMKKSQGEGCQSFSIAPGNLIRDPLPSYAVKSCSLPALKLRILFKEVSAMETRC